MLLVCCLRYIVLPCVVATSDTNQLKTDHSGGVFYPSRAEIGQLEVPVPSDEEVGRLHVAMNPPAQMDEVKRLCHNITRGQQVENNVCTNSDAACPR